MTTKLIHPKAGRLPDRVSGLCLLITLTQQSDTLSADNIARGLMVESGNKTAMNPSAAAKFSYTVSFRQYPYPR